MPTILCYLRDKFCLNAMRQNSHRAENLFLSPLMNVLCHSNRKMCVLIAFFFHIFTNMLLKNRKNIVGNDILQ